MRCKHCEVEVVWTEQKWGGGFIDSDWSITCAADSEINKFIQANGWQTPIYHDITTEERATLIKSKETE